MHQSFKDLEPFGSFVELAINILQQAEKLPSLIG